MVAKVNRENFVSGFKILPDNGHWCPIHNDTCIDIIIIIIMPTFI